MGEYEEIARKAFEREDVKELLKEYDEMERIKGIIIESIGYFSVSNKKLENIIYAFKISKEKLKDLYSINEDYAVMTAYKIANTAISNKKEEMEKKVKEWLE